MANKIIPYKSSLKKFSGKLRRESTLSEVLLWQQIKSKSLGVEFHRQVAIDKYIVDFYCHELMLAIEIDGSSHVDDKKDLERQNRLESLGVYFIRFNDIVVKKNMDSVVMALFERVRQLQGQ